VKTLSCKKNYLRTTSSQRRPSTRIADVPSSRRGLPTPVFEVVPTPRRGLNRTEAAIYIGVSPSKFDDMVKDGRMCPPKRIDARVVWDIRQLDAAFESLPNDVDDASNPWDEA
jgi:predicted DNA-binding transcriptional regulator AlpA